MQDGIIKGTGNSRFLKSVPDFLSQYPTYESFVEALAAGTLPVDFNGINETGWQQLGTALNKGNLLSDETAAMLGLPNTATPNDAFKIVPGVGDIRFSTSNPSLLAELGNKFLPCSGQILDAKDYPKLAAVQGPIPGWEWTTKSAASFPGDLIFNTSAFVQTPTGRVIVCGQRTSGGRFEIAVSDDGCKSFQTKLVLNTSSPSQSTPIPDGGIYSTAAKKILLFGYGARWSSGDNGETWKKEKVSGNSDSYFRYVCELPGGRLVCAFYYASYSDDYGLTWTTTANKASHLFALPNGWVIAGTSTRYSDGSSSDDHSRRYLYLSKDRGETYNQVFYGISADMGTFLNIFQYNENVVFAVTGVDVLASFDFGETWGIYNTWYSDNEVSIGDAAVLVNHTVVSGRAGISVDGLFSWVPTPLVLASYRNIFVLQNGDVVAIDDYSKIWAYGKPSSSVVILPTIPNALIRVK